MLQKQPLHLIASSQIWVGSLYCRVDGKGAVVDGGVGICRSSSSNKAEQESVFVCECVLSASKLCMGIFVKTSENHSWHNKGEGQWKHNILPMADQHLKVTASAFTQEMSLEDNLTHTMDHSSVLLHSMTPHPSISTLLFFKPIRLDFTALFLFFLRRVTPCEVYPRPAMRVNSAGCCLRHCHSASVRGGDTMSAPRDWTENGLCSDVSERRLNPVEMYFVTLHPVLTLYL